MRRHLVPGFAIALALAVPPAPARAGTYPVVACADASGSVNNSWSPSNNAPTKLEIGDSCSPTDSYGGLYAQDRLAVPNASSGSAAMWTFNAPTGTSITALSYSRWLYKEDDDDWRPAAIADGLVLETCTITYPAVRCSAGSQAGSRISFSVANAQLLTVGVACSPNPTGNCSNGGTLHAAIAVLYGATVTLSDSSNPSVSNVAGDLFGGGYVTGARSVSFDATDNVGIRSARVLVDGQPLPATTYGCDFTYVIPCSNRSGSALAVDTRTLADGDHTVEVGASDPASNEGRSPARAITVDNGAPSSPVGLSVEGGSSHPVNDFSATWTVPSGQVSPVVAAHWRICDSLGDQCRAGRQAGPSISRLDGLTVGSPGDWRLYVWLEDAAGNLSAANAATASLQYSVPTPYSDAGANQPAIAANPVDPAVANPQIAADRWSPGSSSSVRRSSPALRVRSARYSRGRLVIAGRTAARASGGVLVTARSSRGLMHVRRTVHGGSFRLVIRTSRPRRITLRFAGSERFRPATLSRLVT
jgi:hypothetical protein